MTMVTGIGVWTLTAFIGIIFRADFAQFGAGVVIIDFERPKHYMNGGVINP